MFLNYRGDRDHAKGAREGLLPLYGIFWGVYGWSLDSPGQAKEWSPAGTREGKPKGERDTTHEQHPFFRKAGKRWLAESRRWERLLTRINLEQLQFLKFIQTASACRAGGSTVAPRRQHSPGAVLPPLTPIAGRTRSQLSRTSRTDICNSQTSGPARRSRRTTAETPRIRIHLRPGPRVQQKRPRPGPSPFALPVLKDCPRNTASPRWRRWHGGRRTRS